MMYTRNHRTSVFPRLAGAVVLVAAALASGVAPAALAQDVSNVHRGQTKPRHEPKLAFYGQGIVAKVLVEEGQRVKAGDVLAVQNDKVETKKVDVAKAALTGASEQIKASEADLAKKRLDLKRKRELYQELIARKQSNTELETAEVEVTIGEIAVTFRKLEYTQKEQELALAQVALDERKLVSPIDGIVAKIDVKAGEGTDLSKPAIVVVQNDTLFVEADLPSAVVKALKDGDTVQVSYMDEKDAWFPAKLVFRTPYANAGSGTRKVRLEMENKAGREAGVNVYVKLPDTAQAAAGK